MVCRPSLSCSFFISPVQNMQSKWPQWIGYLLLITFMVLGIKSFRDEEGGGFISFGRLAGYGYPDLDFRIHHHWCIHGGTFTFIART